MAAPSSTVWGSIVNGSSDGRKGRLGIYTSVSSTNSQTTVNVQVWFWTIYSCSDGAANDLYYNVGTSVTSATTKVASKINIDHTVATGSTWNTANQTKVLDKTYTYDRGTSAVTYKVYAKFSGIDILNGPVSANTSYTIPALTKYTISYNANGGSGAPANQTKYYGKNITLSSTKPTRTGYSFQGWALTKANADAGTWYYSAGGTCGKNENLTLYAVWKANTYAVKYNANGGTGAPAQQTKTYGVTLKLSSTIPKRTNYNFLGWATSASATTKQYSAGANYTTNSAVTLYAVWELAYVKPRITNLAVGRVKQIVTEEITYKPSDAGTYVAVSFDWECDQAVSSITIELEPESGAILSATPTVSGISGSVGEIISDVLTDSTYTVRITVTDAAGYNVALETLPGTAFVIDIFTEGKGIAFNKPAELEGVADIGFKTRFLGGILHPVLEPEKDLDDVLTPNTYVGANVSTHSYGHCPLTSGTFTLEVAGMGEEGQLKQRLTSCHKTNSRAWERIRHVDSNGAMSWGDWICVSDFDGQLLWSGSYFMTADHTINLVEPDSEPVSKQRSGIVLVFSYYDNAAQKALNQEMFEFFIPKYTINKHSGSGRNFNLCGMWRNGVKYLYLSDNKIVGHEKNNQTFTIGGITYDNSGYVLRYVIGV